MRAGPLRDWVTLAKSPDVTDDADGMYESLDPERVPCTIEYLSPQDIERSLTAIVTMRYHDGITFDTRIATDDGKHLFVRGIQDVNNRHVELRLLCSEART